MAIQENALNSALAEALAAAWDQSASKKLKAFPELDKDAIRHALDSAVVEAVPGLSDYDLAHWRRLIALEPGVNNEKGPFRLT